MKQIRRLGIILFVIALLFSVAKFNVHAVNEDFEMTTSEEGIAYIKSEEGFSKYPYYDYGQYTVGYGTRCPGDKYSYYKEHGITEEEADALIRDYIKTAEGVINERLLKKYELVLTQNQFDAIMSFTYNLGPGWMYGTPGTFHKTITNQNSTENEIIRAFSLYCHAGDEFMSGLMRRRLCEANMFLNGVYSRTRNSNYAYVHYDTNGGTIDNKVQGFDSTLNTKPFADAKCDGHTFVGWYTQRTGGTKVDSLSLNLNGSTLYARWDSEQGVDPEPMDPVKITVTANAVNIRTGPGTNHERIAQANKGDQLTITQIETGTGLTWGKSEKGWICLKYTDYGQPQNDQPTEETTPPTTEPPIEETVPETTEPPVSEPPAETTPPETEPPVTNPPETEPSDNQNNTEESTNPDDDFAENNTTVFGRINVNDALRIRKDAGTNHAIVGYLHRNDKVEILEQKNVGNVAWGRIDRGWISMEYVVVEKNENTNHPQQPEETTVIKGIIKVDSFLRIRSKAGTNNSIVGYLHKNDKVEITETTTVGSTTWGRISNGWISMDYVTITNDSSSGTSNETSQTKTITADCLRIRSDAGTENKIVGYYYQNNKVEILDTKKASDGTLWGRTSKGWISMSYTK